MKARIPCCRRNAEQLNDKTTDELMNIIEPDKLNLIQTNKLIIVRRFVIFISISNFFYQYQNMEKMIPFFKGDYGNIEANLLFIYWIMWFILVILIILSQYKNRTRLVYI